MRRLGRGDSRRGRAGAHPPRRARRRARCRAHRAGAARARRRVPSPWTITTRDKEVSMTLRTDPGRPLPARPRPGPRRRSRTHHRRAALPHTARGLLALGAVALVLAATFASCRLLGGLAPVGRPHSRAAVRPAATKATLHLLRVRWGVDRLADPTALLVDGTDAFVTEPSAVSSIGVADGATRWRVDVKDAEPWIAASAGTVLVGAVDGFEALVRATGASRWRVTIEDPYDRGRTVGLVTTRSGPVAVLTTQKGGVVGVDATTGATRWSATVDGSPRGRLVTDDATGLVALQADHGA